MSLSRRINPIEPRS